MTEIPTLDLTVSVQVELPEAAVLHDKTHDVICDFVGGWGVCDTLGIGLQSISNRITVVSASVAGGSTDQVSLAAPRMTREAQVTLYRRAYPSSCTTK